MNNIEWMFLPLGLAGVLWVVGIYMEWRWGRKPK